MVTFTGDRCEPLQGHGDQYALTGSVAVSQTDKASLCSSYSSSSTPFAVCRRTCNAEGESCSGKCSLSAGHEQKH
eukprot:4089563-Pyramimonas_sp.AAC.1